MSSICQVCGSTEWMDLPNPIEGRVITTAGRMLEESLGKSLCASCGFGQRTRARFLGDTDYYEQDYASYYDRPGTARFHIARYRAFAEWMTSVLQSFSPSSILDVGCGQGWAMEAMHALHPQAKIEGLEPSSFNGARAREKGFLVHESRMGETGLAGKHYDLVYSNNVIQHVTDARKFIISLRDVVTEHGSIIVTCPDGSVPNIEILWADQNFSFLPLHLIRLCNEAGFRNVAWFPSPRSPAIPPAQMLSLSKDVQLRQGRLGETLPAPSLRDVYRSKCEYLGSFKEIDAYLFSRTASYERVLNLGASYWSSILAAYCPRYWSKVSACLVEGVEDIQGRFLDKEVLELTAVRPEGAMLVLGTSPATHDVLAEKLAPTWKDITAWNQFAPQY